MCFNDLLFAVLMARIDRAFSPSAAHRDNLSQGDALGWDNGAPLALGPVLAEDWIGKLGWQREGRASGAEARVDYVGFMRGLKPRLPPPSVSFRWIVMPGL
jgi:hypothetical protein